MKTRTNLTTIQEIKQAVDEGKTVYEGNGAYQVIKDKIGQYLIKYQGNGYAIGLTNQAGDKLNGKEFFTFE